MNFFQKIKDGLKKTREKIFSKFNELFSMFTKVDEDFLDKLEEILISSDISVEASAKIKDDLRNEIKIKGINNPKEILDILKDIIIDMLKENEDLNEDNSKNNLLIIIALGVNGVGKTTTLGKLGFKFKNEGKKVLFAAADTFRAAAVEQLVFWAEKIDCQIVTKDNNSDPGSVVFEALDKASLENFDVLLCDTSGRLHNNENLMLELSKINKIIEKKIKKNNGSYEPFLVIDSNMGQNALIQATEFSKIIKISGIIITKLDGTSRGGSLISIKHKLNIPIKYIGIGEKLEDFQKFSPKDFVDALFQDEIKI